MAKPRSEPVLAGWYVISLRPSGTHAPVRRAAAALGGRVLPVSTLKLAAMPAGAALAVALACPCVIFTSPAAVQFARRQQALAASPGQRWLAIGNGTVAALKRSRIAATAPARADSEGLLALDELQAVQGLEVGLVTAPGGRGLIAEALAQRGARVHRAEVYRRLPVRPRRSRLALLDELPARSALLVSSAEAFDGLWARLPESSRERLRSRPVVASSARLAAMLAEQGFAAIVPADSALPSKLLSALAADVAAGRFR